MNKRLLPMRKTSVAKKAVITVGLVSFALIISAIPVLAQSDLYGNSQLQGVKLTNTNLVDLIVRGVNWVLGFIGLIFVVLIMYSGFIWMTAGGDSEKVERAKVIIKNLVIGLVILLASMAIVNFIMGFFNGGNGATEAVDNRPGSSVDLGRWGIGGGPIENVYPVNGQADVSINTSIAVTFKEKIKTDTICEIDANGKCGKIKNVSICLLDDKNNCVNVDDTFGVNAFAETRVSTSSDGRTFLFSPSKYLGIQDGLTRSFQVNLGEGIRTVAQPTKSVFASIVGQQFKWYFITNGKLDLDPPHILNMNGVYPMPDDQQDVYNLASGPTASMFTFSTTSVFQANSEVEASTTQPVRGDNTFSDAVLSGKYVGTESGTVVVSIDSTSGEVVSRLNSTEISRSTSSSSSILNIGNLGLTFTLSGVVERGNSWSFVVTAHQSGDRIDVVSGNGVSASYTFGKEIIKTGATYTIADVVRAIKGTVFEPCASDLSCSIKTIKTGKETGGWNMSFIKDGNMVTGGVTKIDGDNAKINRTVKGYKDPFKNSIIQINFNEAINPALLDNIIVRKDNVVMDRSLYEIKLSNQYTTVELNGKNECGINSCGQKIYCWDTNGNNTTKYEVEVGAASLVTGDSAWCTNWGGSDSMDNTNRCLKNINGVKVFYPRASDSLDGITDMAMNSLNGSLNTYVADSVITGIANGQSGDGIGHSGKTTYDLNGAKKVEGEKFLGFNISDPTIVGGYGDNFKWSFIMSDEVDLQSPLVKNIFPSGDAQVSDRSLLVKAGFDRLMRSSTLKPGFNYGQENTREGTERYLILDTVAKNALPVGYWVGKEDKDINNDGLAEETGSITYHSAFAENGVEYAPFIGSGVQSITQNCFLPSFGPADASDSKNCVYVGGIPGSDCVNLTDNSASIASYAKLNCADIKGAHGCTNDKPKCDPLFNRTTSTPEGIGGSWIITKDYPASKYAPDSFKGVGCCFGKCVAE